MPLLGGGPKDRWEYELERLGRSSLVCVVQRLLFSHSCFFGPLDREHLSKVIAEAKKEGRWENSHRRWERFQADPEGEIEKTLRRQRSAKTSVRRRKAAARRAVSG